MCWQEWVCFSNSKNQMDPLSRLKSRNVRFDLPIVFHCMGFRTGSSSFLSCLSHDPQSPLSSSRVTPPSRLNILHKAEESVSLAEWLRGRGKGTAERDMWWAFQGSTHYRRKPGAAATEQDCYQCSQDSVTNVSHGQGYSMARIKTCEGIRLPCF